MTFEKVLEVFNDYLNKDSVLEVVNTKRGYTVMIWDEKDEQWFGVEHCKAPELLLLWSSFFVTLRPNFHYRSYTLP